MTRLFLSGFCVAVVGLFQLDASAHCQVPCGIFSDQLRFESMLEDQTTIAKAIGEVDKLLAEETTAVSVNQTARWIMTKEEHAVKIQETVAKYFLAQRIKPGEDDASNEKYVEQLKAAHAVTRAAMKSKQAPTAETAEALKTAIFDLYRAYEGKEPDFE